MDARRKPRGSIRAGTAAAIGRPRNQGREGRTTIDNRETRDPSGAVHGVALGVESVGSDVRRGSDYKYAVLV